MTDAEFEKIFETSESINGHPIFRHANLGILIAGDGEFAGEKELCKECSDVVAEYGFCPNCDCQQDIPFVGLWTPVDWKCEQPANYAIRDENTTDEMENCEDLPIVDVSDLEFTGKFRRN